VIGIVGPKDSIALVLQVASEMKNVGALVARSYVNPEASLKLTREIENHCDLILFTGRIPHALALKDSQQWGPKLQYIPHTGTDLFHTIVRVLLTSQGKMPRISIDTISEEWVKETFEEIELPIPDHVMPFSETNLEAVPSSEEVLAFHVSHWKSGSVEVCLTCLGSVYDQLQELGIPSWRISHTRTSLRKALENATLNLELVQSLSTTMALALVKLPIADKPGNSDPYQVQIQQLRTQELAIQMSQQLRGQLIRALDAEFLIATSRGMVEETISRLQSGQRSAIDVSGLPDGVHVGFGVGVTPAAAEANARRAIELSERFGGTNALLTDGHVLSSRSDNVLNMREVQSGARTISESLNLGPLSFTRLISALRRLDTQALTARQLGDVYGVETRSARRIIRALVRVGYAVETGREVSTAAGRPQSVFSVDLNSLLHAVDDNEPSEGRLLNAE
jgi:hypothetical protein